MRLPYITDLFEAMKRYGSDVTDSQWNIIKSFFDYKRRRKYELRIIVNAIFYLVKTGCQWRMLPREFPPWQTVYYYYRRWRKEGLIEQVLDQLRAQVRQKMDREPGPSAAIIDCQSVKTTRKGGIRGFDAFKKVKGRKRHVVVDTQGLLVAVKVHGAHRPESQTALPLLETVKQKCHRLKVLFADQAYQGELVERVKELFGWVLNIVRRQSTGFEVLPKRWIVERTFAWFESYRRLSKEYEYLPETSETMIQLAMIRLMLNRLG